MPHIFQHFLSIQTEHNIIIETIILNSSTIQKFRKIKLSFPTFSATKQSIITNQKNGINKSRINHKSIQQPHKKLQPFLLLSNISQEPNRPQHHHQHQNDTSQQFNHSTEPILGIINLNHSISSTIYQLQKLNFLINEAKHCIKLEQLHQQLKYKSRISFHNNNSTKLVQFFLFFSNTSTQRKRSKQAISPSNTIQHTYSSHFPLEPLDHRSSRPDLSAEADRGPPVDAVAPTTRSKRRQESQGTVTTTDRGKRQRRRRSRSGDSRGTRRMRRRRRRRRRQRNSRDRRREANPRGSEERE